MFVNRARIRFLVSLFLFALFFCLSFGAPGLTARKAEAAQTGIVEAIKPTAWVERNGKRYELRKGSPINDFDTVKTGDGATLTIRFIDDTVIELSPDSEMSVLDIAHTARSSRFSVYVTKGGALVNTGGIGLKNSAGVCVTTPKGIVMANDAVVWIGIGVDEEVVRIEDMTRGPKVSVYNSSTSHLMVARSSRYSIVTDASNEMREIELAPESPIR
jgi:aspartate 1-decarboxylase